LPEFGFGVIAKAPLRSLDAKDSRHPVLIEAPWPTVMASGAFFSELTHWLFFLCSGEYRMTHPSHRPLHGHVSIRRTALALAIAAGCAIAGQVYAQASTGAISLPEAFDRWPAS